MVPNLSANRFNLGNPKGVAIDYSNDAGKTWTDYGANDAAKISLISNTSDDELRQFLIGKKKSETPSNDMLRVTIDTSDDQGIGMYGWLNKFIIYVATCGSDNAYCTLQKALRATPDTFVTVSEKVKLSGWNGYNVINISGIPTYGYDGIEKTNYSKIRFIFGCTGNTTDYQGLTIFRIWAYGTTAYKAKSIFSQQGTPYEYFHDKSVRFDGSVILRDGISINGGLSNQCFTTNGGYYNLDEKLNVKDIISTTTIEQLFNN